MKKIGWLLLMTAWFTERSERKPLPELTPCPKGIGVNILRSWRRVTTCGNPKGRSPVAVRRVNALRFGIVLLVFLFVGQLAQAKVDLVTLPKRESVQLTIYNSADLTLARENRYLTLKEGLNEMQFSWANTLIDPTSLEMIPKEKADLIDVFDLTFPARVKNLGLWHIQSGLSGQVPVEINYLTSGLSWRAFYLGTLTPDEKKMLLKGYVRVTNNSGEDYENAQVRLIVGQVHLIDEIVQLAQREHPFGRPGYGDVVASGADDEMIRGKGLMRQMQTVAYEMAYDAPMPEGPKQIIKEGLSEYFLYTIEGSETIPDGWSKRLPSFEAQEVPVINLYKFEEERYGLAVVRFLSFKNDKQHKLGETPIPGGVIKVFRMVDKDRHLSYEGQSDFKYIPVEEDVELNLGVVRDVVVESTLMGFKTKDYAFDQYKNITGWEEEREVKVIVKNTRPVPVKVEVKRNFNEKKWKIKNQGDHGKFEEVDADTVKYTLELNPQSRKEFRYVLTTYHGTRADRR